LLLNKNINICHLAIIHDVFSDSRIKDKMAYSAAAEGHNVSIITSNTEDVEIGNVKVFGVSRSKLPRLKVLTSLWRVYGLAKKQSAQLYHIHEIPLMPVGLLLLLIDRKAVVMDFHEDFEAELLSKFYLSVFVRYLFLYAYKLWKRCTLPLFSGVILAEDS
jgi:hypothetical protein